MQNVSLINGHVDGEDLDYDIKCMTEDLDKIIEYGIDSSEECKHMDYPALDNDEIAKFLIANGWRKAF